MENLQDAQDLCDIFEKLGAKEVLCILADACDSKARRFTELNLHDKSRVHTLNAAEIRKIAFSLIREP